MNIEIIRIQNAIESQIAELTNVILSAPRFSLLCEGRLPDAGDVPEMLEALPPKVSHKSKYFYGIHLNGNLIGCIDVIRGWPENDTAHIGLLLLVEQYQGKGIGRMAFNALCRVISSWPEVEKFRIGVIATNTPAFPFWKALGFSETGEITTNPMFIDDVIIFERSVD